MNKMIVFRIFAAFVLIAAIGGIAFFAFQAGVAKGSPVTIEAPSGETVQMPYFAPYGMPYGRGFHHAPFFGCFGLLIPLFFLFLAMKAFRFMFWGPRWAHHIHGHHGPWRNHWENGVPPMFEEWHKRAHGEKTAEEPANDKKE